VDEEGFIGFLKLTFGQKRKILLNNLRERYGAEPSKKALADAKVKPDVRAEALSLEKMAGIYRALKNGSSQ
jgi:16S rRNA A1518/A1519 N6-dimethyltransferase RsmA/KsgA/DIM1 with predicted DNA glycosylase/AP lyase activity